MGILADIEAISEGSAKLATDQATLNADRAAVEAQQEMVANDTAANLAADAMLSSDLQAIGGPVFVLNEDGSVAIYQYAGTPPGYTITKAIPAT